MYDNLQTAMQTWFCERCVLCQMSHGACFAKVLRLFRALKASHQTALHWFWKADLLTCFWCMKNQGVWWLRTLVLQRYNRNRGTWNRPKNFWDFWETGPKWRCSLSYCQNVKCQNLQSKVHILCQCTFNPDCRNKPCQVF